MLTITISGKVTKIEQRWNIQTGQWCIFYLDHRSIKGFPTWVNPGQLPLRIRQADTTGVTGKVAKGAHVYITGILSLNEFYKGEHLPPHMDAESIVVEKS